MATFLNASASVVHKSFGSNIEYSTWKPRPLRMQQLVILGNSATKDAGTNYGKAKAACLNANRVNSLKLATQSV